MLLDIGFQGGDSKVQISFFCCFAATASGGAASPSAVRSTGLCFGRSPRTWIHPNEQGEDGKSLLLLLHGGISLNKKSTFRRNGEIPFTNDLFICSFCSPGDVITCFFIDVWKIRIAITIFIY